LIPWFTLIKKTEQETLYFFVFKGVNLVVAGMEEDAEVSVKGLYVFFTTDILLRDRIKTQDKSISSHMVLQGSLLHTPC
jgi:hypothetical protein